MNKLLTSSVRALTVLVLLATAKCAYADQFYFSFSGPATKGMGLIATNPESGGSFLVTGFEPGDFDGAFGMFWVAADTYGNNDNLVFPSGPYVDAQGLGFLAGGTNWNLYYDSSLSEYLLCEEAVNSTCEPGDGTVVTFSYFGPPPPPVPEPGTLLTLGSGLLALVGLRRKSVRKSIV